MTRRTARALSISLGALALLGAIAAPSARATGDGDAVELTAFVGTYRFVNSARDRRSYDEGVVRAVRSLNALIRGIAESQMRRRVRPEPAIAFASRARGHLTVTLGSWTSPSMRVDGPARRIAGPDGSPTRFSVTQGQGRLVTRAETHDGARESFFSLSPDGAYLFMQVRITATQMPESIRFTLTYRRQR